MDWFSTKPTKNYEEDDPQENESTSVNDPTPAVDSGPTKSADESLNNVEKAMDPNMDMPVAAMVEEIPFVEPSAQQETNEHRWKESNTESTDYSRNVLDLLKGTTRRPEYEPNDPSNWFLTTDPSHWGRWNVVQEWNGM